MVVLSGGEGGVISIVSPGGEGGIISVVLSGGEGDIVSIVGGVVSSVGGARFEPT